MEETSEKVRCMGTYQKQRWSSHLTGPSLLFSYDAVFTVLILHHRSSPDTQISLEDFVIADDDQLYGLPTQRQPAALQDALPLTPSSCRSISSQNGLDSSASVSSLSHQVVLPSGMIASQTQSHSLRSLMESSTLKIQNPYPTLSSLHTHLSSLSLPSTNRLRPSWDTYFLSLCTLASLRSNCMKRRVGAVLIRNNRVLSTGYNGTPRGLTNCAEGGCSRCNGGAAGGTALDECLCLHAEENALLECGRERGGAEGTVLYCNTWVKEERERREKWVECTLDQDADSKTFLAARVCDVLSRLSKRAFEKSSINWPTAWMIVLAQYFKKLV